MASFKINGSNMAEPAPNGATLAIQDIDSSAAGRLQNGEMVRDRVAQKIKWSFKFPPLSGDEMSVILSAINSEDFNFTYPNPYSSNNSPTTGSFYCGDRTTPIYWNNNGKILWTGLQVNFIEK